MRKYAAVLLKCLRIGPATELRSLCEGCCRLVNKLQESVLQESVPPMGLFVITKLSTCSIKQSRALCGLSFAQSRQLMCPCRLSRASLEGLQNLPTKAGPGPGAQDSSHTTEY